MRVIAGRCRGRTLRAPAGAVTRPTADRVREAIFDVLGSMGPIEDLRVADLFAGSGAMGIEALSRGAASAVFVDRAPEALAAVRANLAALELESRATVVRADVLAWLLRAATPATPATPDTGEATPRDVADLVLCDPPYDFDRWPELLERLRAPLVVLESSRPVEVPPPWAVLRQKRYGGTLVTVVGRDPGEPNDQHDQKGHP